MSLFFALAALLLVLWVLGLLGNFTFGGALHLLLVLAVVVLVLSLASPGGRSTRFRFNTNPGMALAGLWFILTGLLGLFGFTFQGQALVMAVLALIAGVLLVMGR